MAPLMTLLIVAVVLVLALGLAYVPMRLLVVQIARNVHHFIQRQRDRRNMPRRSPDRRKAPLV